MRGQRWLLMAILLLATGLRFHDLGTSSLWMDEAVSVFAARAPMAEALGILLTDGVHPPLYYFLQEVSYLPVAMASASEFALRWPAALLGVLGVATLARVARAWLGGAAAPLAALFLAISPFAVWYSREARMYSLMVLLWTGVMGAFTACFATAEGRSSRARYALFIHLSAALYLTHYFGLFAPLIQFVYLLLTFRRNYSHLRPWTAAQVLAAVPIGLWLVALYRRGAYFGIGWIAAVRWPDLLLTLQNFAVGYGEEIWRWAATALVGGLAGLGLWGLHRERVARSELRAGLLALWLLVPPLATWLLSRKVPLYVDRFLIGGLPPLLLATAAGIRALGRPGWRGVPLLAGLTVAAVMGLGTLGLFDNQAHPREDWRAVAHHIQAEERPTDVLLLRSLTYWLPLRIYYAGGLEPQAIDVGWQPATPAGQHAQHGRLWLVYRGRLQSSHRFATSLAPDFDRDEGAADTRAWLRSMEPYLVERRDFPGVAVMLYDFPAGGYRP